MPGRLTAYRLGGGCRGYTISQPSRFTAVTHHILTSSKLEGRHLPTAPESASKDAEGLIVLNNRPYGTQTFDRRDVSYETGTIVGMLGSRRYRHQHRLRAGDGVPWRNCCRTFAVFGSLVGEGKANQAWPPCLGPAPASDLLLQRDTRTRPRRGQGSQWIDARGDKCPVERVHCAPIA